MVSRVSLGYLACLVGFGFGATPALAADDFSDFPDMPAMERFDTTFQDAGFYAGLRGGAVWPGETDFTIVGAVRVDNDYNTGFSGSVFAGYDIPDLYWGFGLRPELEIGYWRSTVDTHTVGGTPTSAANSFGATSAWTAMANLYAAYDLGAFGAFGGGGIGVARVTFDNHGVTAAPGVMDDESDGFAWQVSGGIDFDLTSNLTLEAMVRYQEILDVELVSATGPTSSVGVSSTHLMLGARVRF